MRNRSLGLLPPAVSAALMALLILCGAPGVAAADTDVDLELVIAVDVSLSMDVDEQRLQRDGYLAALRDPELHKAILAGPRGRIAIAYMEWAGPATQSIVVPWTLVDGAAAAIALADQLEAVPISRARMTSISSALEFSGRMFGGGYTGVRRVIDVSGDGPNNAGAPVTLVRDELVAQGVIINGLPIMLKQASNFFDLPDLDRYYAECVIGGTGAFMIAIKNPSEFRTATRRKLLLEISGFEAPARVIPVQDAAPRSDCLAGEKQWQRYQERGFN